MKSPEKFDFSKKEDQEQFDKLPEEPKKILVDHFHGEALKENDDFDEKMHKSKLSRSNYLYACLESNKMPPQKTRKDVYLELFELDIELENWYGALDIAEKMGDAGKKELPRILKGFINAYDFDSAEKLAKKMGKNGQDILLQGYLEKNELVYAEELAKKIGKKEEILPKLIEGYIKRAEKNVDNMSNGPKNLNSWENDLAYTEDLVEEMKQIKKDKREAIKGKKDFLIQIFNLYLRRNSWDKAEELIEKMEDEEKEPLANALLDRYMERDIWDTWKRAEKFAEKMKIKDERLIQIYEHTNPEKAKSLKNS